MVNISISPSFVLPAGIPATAFTLQLGGGYAPAVDIVKTGDPLQHASAWTSNLKVGETLTFDNEIFEGLVKNDFSSFLAGAFIPRVIYYVSRGILVVTQDGGSALTAKQILNYTAP